MDLAVDMAVSGVGIIGLFEEWLQPHIKSGCLVPVLPDWWSSFPGPFLYYSGRRLVPPPLRAFLDFIKSADLSPLTERPTTAELRLQPSSL
jgi:DNA-binding transcriptional LysR family regulator